MNDFNNPTSRRRVLKLAGILLANLALLPRVSHGRIWTNNQGRKIEADLIEIVDGGNAVTLRRADGLLFTIPVSTLSEADRRFLGVQVVPGGGGSVPPAGGKDVIRRRIRRLRTALRRAMLKGNRRMVRRLRSAIARLEKRL